MFINSLLLCEHVYIALISLILYLTALLLFEHVRVYIALISLILYLTAATVIHYMTHNC